MRPTTNCQKTQKTYVQYKMRQAALGRAGYDKGRQMESLYPFLKESNVFSKVTKQFQLGTSNKNDFLVTEKATGQQVGMQLKYATGQTHAYGSTINGMLNTLAENIPAFNKKTNRLAIAWDKGNLKEFSTLAQKNKKTMLNTLLRNNQGTKFLSYIKKTNGIEYIIDYDALINYLANDPTTFTLTKSGKRMRGNGIISLGQKGSGSDEMRKSPQLRIGFSLRKIAELEAKGIVLDKIDRSADIKQYIS
jgi:hypothetical protein